MWDRSALIRDAQESDVGKSCVIKILLYRNLNLKAKLRVYLLHLLQFLIHGLIKLLIFHLHIVCWFHFYFQLEAAEIWFSKPIFASFSPWFYYISTWKKATSKTNLFKVKDVNFSRKVLSYCWVDSVENDWFYFLSSRIEQIGYEKKFEYKLWCTLKLVQSVGFFRLNIC